MSLPGFSINPEWTYIHNNATGAKSFLWIPNSGSSGIRALFIATHTSIDKLLATDSVFRAMAEKEQLAILYTRQNVSCFGAAADTSRILDLLDTLSDRSGFKELKNVPWVTWGHSAGTSAAVGFGYWKPSRTIAVITHSGNLLRPNWTNPELPNVPFMAIKGQYEEWSVGTNNPAQCGTEYEYNWVRDTVISARQLNVSPFLGCATMRPGEGHMGLNTKLAIPLIALFVQKAIQKRVPKGSNASSGPVVLNAIDESKGWLTATNITTNFTNLLIDSFPNVSDPKNHFWHLDKEMAMAWYNYQKDVLKTQQNLNMRANPPTTSPNINFSFGNSANNDCGLNFSGTGADMSKTYNFSNLVATSGLPVKLFVQDGPGYFSSENVLATNPCLYDLNNKTRILMRQDGNETYQIRDRQIVLTINKKNSGTAQTASLASVFEAHPGDSISFTASLTSGLTPEVQILSGPGVLLPGNKIKVLPFASKTGSTKIVLRAAHVGNATFASSNLAEISIPVTTLVPFSPGHISGFDTVLAPSSNVVYTVSEISNANTYEWIMPPFVQIVSGQGSNSIVVNFLAGYAGGLIKVTGINPVGEGLPAYKEVVLKTTTSTIEKIGSNPISVYPNPGLGHFHYSGIHAASEISVLDISGKLILKQFADRDGQIQLDEKPGIYWLEVKSENWIFRKKLMVLGQ